MKFFSGKFMGYDFNFKDDRSNRFVPFIIGFLMYSLSIVLMSCFFVHNLTFRWKDALAGRITVEFQSDLDRANKTFTDKQSEEIIKIIKSTEGIKSVRQLKETDMLKILEPWLSGTAIPDDFPFPVIFDVETDGNSKIDLSSLADKLSKSFPEVKIHDHADWYAPLGKISKGLFGFSAILSVLIFMTVCITVVFIVKKTLMVHRNTVNILQLIGAHNSYIASQFKRYYFAVGCGASLMSIFCSLLTIVGIVFISSGEILDMNTIKYAVVAIAIPVITTILAMNTSRNTVLFLLKKDRIDQ